MAQVDEQLLDAWCAGDRKAGDELLRLHFAMLYRFFRNKVGDDADDLIQQTLLACVKHRDRFRRQCSFRTYLLQIARSKMYDHFRKKQRSRVDPDFGVSSARDLGSSPSTVASRNRKQAQLLQALQRIPVQLQVVLELFYWEDMTSEELAEVLEVPVGTAKSRLRRAREALAKELAKPGVEDADALSPDSIRASRPDPARATKLT